jgi:sialate O-acetylesterase
MFNSCNSLFRCFAAIMCFAVFASDAGAQAKIGIARKSIWVLAGQSNMSGCGRFTGFLPPDQNITMLNMDDRWITAVDPLHRIYDSNSPVIRRYFKQVHKGTDETFLENRRALHTRPSDAFLMGVGMGHFFAAQIRGQIDIQIGLVPCAYGGTLMSDWDPANRSDPNGSLYQYMLDRIAAADGKIDGVLWSQGEGDGCYPEKARNYQKNMLNFIDTLRRDTNSPDLPFFIVQTGRFCTGPSPQPGPDWEIVRDAQRRIADLRHGVYVIASLDVPLDDPIHISAAGHARTGKRLAEIALSKVYHVPGHANPIRLASIEYVDPNRITSPPCFPKPIQMRIKFEGVNGKLTAQGRPTGFEFRSTPSAKNRPMFYRVEFDVNEPAMIILWLAQPEGPLEPGLTLIYGGGMDPYVNIVDEFDMPVPAFGPITLPKPGQKILFDKVSPNCGSES